MTFGVFSMKVHELKICWIYSMCFLIWCVVDGHFQNAGFLWPVYYRIRENTGQREPVFWHILSNSVFVVSWLILIITSPCIFKTKCQLENVSLSHKANPFIQGLILSKQPICSWSSLISFFTLKTTWKDIFGS